MSIRLSHKLTRTIRRSAWLFYVIVAALVMLTYIVCRLSSISPHTRRKYSQFDLQLLLTQNSARVPTDKPLLLNLTFSADRVYHHDGVAYDYYSMYDVGLSQAGSQWRIWPLPHEMKQTSFIDQNQLSPFVVRKLPFVDAVYVLTDPSLTDRHANLKKAFDQQGIAKDSIEWRMKWNRTTCNAEASRSYVYQRLNLKNKSLDKNQRARCALTMKHVDVWYEMAERRVGLALILEDDAIFVPFFKEKFIRVIHAGLRNGILRMNGSCVKSIERPISNTEWIHQNPMIVIGTCLAIHDKHFQKDLPNASPILTTHKSNPSRCAHAYLLTACSAQALVDQLQIQKNDFWPPDFLQNHLVPSSSTLQSFWVDPPLAYQGNQVTDLDNIPSFKVQTYTVET